MTTRVAMRAAMRGAVVDLLAAYAADSSSGEIGPGLQIYPTIPTSIKPPTAFVERIAEADTYPGINQRQRLVVATAIVLWRTFLGGERGDAVQSADAFMDGFSDWVMDHLHQPGPTELISTARIEEDPYYQLNDQKRGIETYLATRITLEGYTTN